MSSPSYWTGRGPTATLTGARSGSSRAPTRSSPRASRTGTEPIPGARWTELFAVFTGPLFDFLAGLGMLGVAGPRYPRPVPSIEALRTVLRTPPQSIGAAEHQLLAMADWLLDTEDTGAEVPGPDISAEVAHAVGRLADDLTGSVELQTLAAESGLTYDTFRRRFTAQVGQSPSAFRTMRRLQTAATLLRLTDMTHREIARTLGFADEFHFSRRFRAQFGVPPRDYRRSRLGRPARGSGHGSGGAVQSP